MPSTDLNPHLTETVQSLIAQGNSKQAEDNVDMQRKIQELTNQARVNRQLHRWRNGFAWLLASIFGLECLSANAAFWFIVVRGVNIPQWVASVFFVSVFGQIVYLTRVAVAYFSRE